MKAIPLLVLFGIAGCIAGGAPDRTPSADPPTAAPGIVVNGERGNSTYSRYAVIQGSCAPWDGAAIELRLSPSQPTAKGPVAPWIVVSIWQSREEASGGTFRFPDNTGRVGAAGHCRNGENYEPVESGMVRFDRFTDGKPATGTFDIVLKGGRRERGTFSAAWGEMRVPCG
ncbi:MAG: hypothetical protein IPF53_01090 [Blastocatellia bacterium]|nr:hypothetical protein [Blastocatellia bacterium]MBK6425252.1 hypothetical protein [Blastocatellia bacterium]